MIATKKYSLLAYSLFKGVVTQFYPIFKEQKKVLQKGSQRTVLVNDSTYVYERKYEKEIALIAINRGKEKVVKLKGLSLPDGKYRDELHLKGAGKIKVKEGKAEIKLPESSAFLWIYEPVKK